MSNFENLNLIEPLLKAIAKEGYTTPTEIQIAAIPVLLSGRDVLGTAQTGTGKTAAYGLPAIQRIVNARKPDQTRRTVQALIVAPTRELAAQIAESMQGYARFANLRVYAIFGGVSKGPQINAVRQGLDIVVGTPGRLLDLVQMRLLNLETVTYFVLDEADQLLDMGFLPDVRKIVSMLKKERVSSMFSATMPREIEILASQILKEPKRISITPVEQPLDKIQQKAFSVDKAQKISFLLHLLKDPAITQALVFTRTKRWAKKVAQTLNQQGIRTEELHGNRSQSARTYALAQFKDKSSRVLVATDIASRGIDIHQLSHVINYELPEVPEVYLHRMGRTGRAGFSGVVISIVSGDEYGRLRDINRHMGTNLVAIKDTTFTPSSIVVTPDAFDRPRQGKSHHEFRRFHGGQKPSGGPSQGPSREQRPFARPSSSFGPRPTTSSGAPSERPNPSRPQSSGSSQSWQKKSEGGSSNYSKEGFKKPFGFGFKKKFSNWNDKKK